MVKGYINKRRINVLNLGAGVQSTTVLLMSIKGELPKLDHAIFADTGWEPQSVYTHLEKLKVLCESNGVPLHILRDRNIRDDVLEYQVKNNKGHLGRSMPMHVKHLDGSKGMIGRRCTGTYKINPIEQFVRKEILQLKPRQRAPKVPLIRQWFGISVDESGRVKQPKEAWRTFYYPLCKLETSVDKVRDVDNGMKVRFNRTKCLEWLKANGWTDVPRSACVCCPYKSMSDWRDLKDSPDWEDALDFDSKIRTCVGISGSVYVHQSCLPLIEAVEVVKSGSSGNGFMNECAGMCGL